ncbi:MAG: hypothetical protein KGQ61_08065 [Planctomycetes bacterium]|nr:hypothetical protein [Planctomycetota bacterium]
MTPLRILVAGMVASHPGQGGAAWAVLQYVLGLRDLGHEVTLVDPATVPDQATGADFAAAPAAAYFRTLVAGFGLSADAALLRAGTTATVGLPHAQLRARAAGADLLLNLSGLLRDPALTEPVARRVFVDLDPAFNQMWHAQGIDMGFDRHDRFVTIAWNIGREGCTVPVCGREWITTPQPVVLDHWPVAGAVEHAALTTVGHWRSYGSVTHDGVFHGQKAHAWRGLLDLPSNSAVPLLPALAIHPAETADLAALRAHGWRWLDPATVCATPGDYRRFVQGSWGELAIAKQGYVVSRCGWFSDRSVCYLASGRPVIAHDTGFGSRLPVGHGLLAFTTVADARAAIDALAADYAGHRRAARELAAAVFDHRIVLPALLERVTAA